MDITPAQQSLAPKPQSPHSKESTDTDPTSDGIHPKRLVACRNCRQAKVSYRNN
jgi:hypothetical protein